MAVARADTRLLEVRVEALGDDFALVSGQWLEGWRVAAALAKAQRVWAFAADDEAEVAGYIEALTGQAGGLVVGIAPGRQPGWEAAGRDAVLRLLGAGEADLTGLLLLTAMPACGLQCSGLAPCQGTNDPDEALYQGNDPRSPHVKDIE